MTKTTKRAPRLLPRKGILLDTAKVRKLGLTWGRRKDGAWLMTRAGWTAAKEAHAIVDSATFKEAARRIEDGENSLACLALADTVGVWHCMDVPETRFFEAVLQPKNSGMFWYGDHSPAGQMARTLGLLLCAELVHEGFEPPGWPT